MLDAVYQNKLEYDIIISKINVDKNESNGFKMLATFSIFV